MSRRKMTIKERYERIDRYDVDAEGLQELAEEQGLKEPNDEIYKAEIKYQYEHAPISNYYSALFVDYDLRNRNKEYRSEYETALKDYKQLERLYNDFCR